MSEAAGCKKPDPRIFQLACDELGVAPGDCWFVGDHPENDILGARRLGMHAVWIKDEVGSHAWPAGSEPESNIPRISALAELLPMLGQP